VFIPRCENAMIAASLPESSLFCTACQRSLRKLMFGFSRGVAADGSIVVPGRRSSGLARCGTSSAGGAASPATGWAGGGGGGTGTTGSASACGDPNISAAITPIPPATTDSGFASTSILTNAPFLVATSTVTLGGSV